MTRTESDRLTIIETKFETVIEPMAFKVDQIYEALPEIVRKVDKHHCVFPDHVETLEVLKKAIIPIKRKSDGNGGYLERRTKKPLKQQFSEMPLGKKITSIVVIITFFGAFGEWILSKAHSIISLLESMFI